MNRFPLLPFTAETAAQKVRMAEDAWNTRDPARVALAYTPDSRWRNRVEFLQGRAEIEAFLKRKWSRELDYRLIKERPLLGLRECRNPDYRHGIKAQDLRCLQASVARQDHALIVNQDWRREPELVDAFGDRLDLAF
jgi:Protein of unknown function (DUF1348)